MNTQNMHLNINILELIIICQALFSFYQNELKLGLIRVSLVLEHDIELKVGLLN